MTRKDPKSLSTIRLHVDRIHKAGQHTIAAFGVFGLPSIPPFDADSDPTSLGPRWQAWRFDIYIAASAIIDDAQKCAGELVQRVFKGLLDTGELYSEASSALDKHFLPKKKTRSDCYVFQQAEQQAGESIGQFAARLHSLALTCNFDNIHEAITDQVLLKCRSRSLKCRVLRDPDLGKDTK